MTQLTTFLDRDQLPAGQPWMPALEAGLSHCGIGYVIRLPANHVLQERIGHLLTRPVGRPPKKAIF